MHPLLSIGSIHRISCTCIIPFKIIFKYFFCNLDSQVGFHKANELKIRDTKCTKCIFSLFIYKDKVIRLLQNSPNLQWTKKENIDLSEHADCFYILFFCILYSQVRFHKAHELKFRYTKCTKCIFPSLYIQIK